MKKQNPIIKLSDTLLVEIEAVLQKYNTSEESKKTLKAESVYNQRSPALKRAVQFDTIIWKCRLSGSGLLEWKDPAGDPYAVESNSYSQTTNTKENVSQMQFVLETNTTKQVRTYLTESIMKIHLLFLFLQISKFFPL